MTEDAVLKLSILWSALLGLLGIIWGLASGSQVILLDGMYGVIGIATGWLLLLAAGLSRSGPTRAFPFGREGVTPLAIGTLGFVLLATLLYAAVEAVLTIRQGGVTFEVGWAIRYAAISTSACVAVWLWLRRNAGHSDLLAYEATAWRLAALEGVGMLVGFTILRLVQDSSWSGVAPYIDPAMVLITCALLLPAPAGMIRTMIVELLEGAPTPGVQEPVLATITSVFDEFHLSEPDIRMTKVGLKLYVEVEGLADPGMTIEQEHNVRRELGARFDTLPYDVWLNLELLPRSPPA
jgi:predicted Co/Zn/Cd cation transporter (cation efflux family)